MKDNLAHTFDTVGNHTLNTLLNTLIPTDTLTDRLEEKHTYTLYLFIDSY